MEQKRPIVDPAPDWTAARCRDEDPELFFPVGTGEVAQRQARRAKIVCARCVLIDPCLRWAIATGVAEGIWGGRTEQERRLMRVEHRALSWTR